ncbi:GNAT family N-acetyltransferase [Streptomyces bambusae]|uniref:GNAT family N-acetyltransferase n=1 Tax=Streptomyces bambusae TaxID=1550616 RepID=UPI001CFE3A45|nr:GNAT family N-acetyltransferase [Streptomyces bambusae]MCB5164910.1 GNAT family N-acetyltransferase [Streptomyces bambusae]
MDAIKSSAEALSAPVYGPDGAVGDGGTGGWEVAAEHFGTPAATALRREYYAEVAGRYWGRTATSAEVDQGLADDPADALTAPTGAFLVGRYGGEPAACAGLRLLDPVTAELTRVFVRPDRRGTGGGGALLAALEAAARSLGAQRIRLDTRTDLVEARGLYAKHGYAEIPAYNSGPYAQHWFEKRLSG